MATNQKKLIDWNGNAKLLLAKIDKRIGKEYEEGGSKETVTWLNELRQALQVSDDVEFLGFMMNRYAEPLMYSAVDALEGVLSTAD